VSVQAIAELVLADTGGVRVWPWVMDVVLHKDVEREVSSSHRLWQQTMQEPIRASSRVPSVVAVRMAITVRLRETSKAIGGSRVVRKLRSPIPSSSPWETSLNHRTLTPMSSSQVTE